MDAMQETAVLLQIDAKRDRVLQWECRKKQKIAELTSVHPHDAIDSTTKLRLDGSRIGSGSARIVARSFIDLGCHHLPCDVSHLLGDVVPASPSFEPLELRIDVDGGPSVEPRRTELGVGRAVA
jgi:hypothetical protein